MSYLLNKSSVIICPKKKYFDWMVSVDGSDKLKHTELELKRSPRVYLVEESPSVDPQDIRKTMELLYPKIAIEEFALWWTLDDQWPDLKDLEHFEEYFEWRFHDTIIDVTETEMIRDEI